MVDFRFDYHQTVYEIFVSDPFSAQDKWYFGQSVREVETKKVTWGPMYFGPYVTEAIATEERDKQLAKIKKAGFPR